MSDRTAVIKNPILPGFNPDPSIVRVGDDYYIATSTFEWFPGRANSSFQGLGPLAVVDAAARRASQLNLLGDADSCGVWAPCLTYADGLFCLIYTDVKRYGQRRWAELPGRHCAISIIIWSPARSLTASGRNPVYLNSSGFDPSLFHDDDGRKYLVNHLWDHRPGRNRFAGIVLQEYSATVRALIGERQNDF